MKIQLATLDVEECRDESILATLRTPDASMSTAINVTADTATANRRLLPQSAIP
jgi:hypothetical protein